MAAPRASFDWVARAGLTAAVAVGLVRVFERGWWILAALAVAVLPHALAALCARWRVGNAATVAVTTGAGALVTMWVVAPHTTAYGWPTIETLRTYGADLRDAPEVLRGAIVPVEPSAGALVLALVALWVAGAAAEWAARRLDAPLGVISPSLVLFVAVAALGDGAWTAVTAAYVLAVALYLLAVHRTEQRAQRAWFGGSERARRSTRTAGGITAAFVLAVVASVAGPLLPGARSEAWFDYRALGDGGGGGILDLTTPLVSVQAKLLQDPQRGVFTVRADEPAYWRVGALEEYTGDVWGLRDERDDARDIQPPRERPPSHLLDQEFRILDADPNWLPAAYHPIGTVEGIPGVRFVASTATLYVESEERLSSLTYEVRSQVPTPSEAQLVRSPAVDPEEHRRTLELPDGFPERIRSLALDVTAGAASPYEQAVALEQFFTATGGFEYTLVVDDRDGRLHDIQTMEDFLFDVRAGYCEQFSASYAAMARAIGIPARVAVGYTSGEPRGNDVWLVRNQNAHAWPELYFEGFGWLPFEPTPGRFEPTTGRGTGAAPPPQPDRPAEADSTTTTAGAATPAFPSTSLPQLDPDRNVRALEPGAADERADPVREVLTFLSLAVATLAVSGVVALSVLTVLAARRTHRRRHASGTRARVLGAWNEAIEQLAAVGVRRRPSATAVEFALRQAPAQGAGDAGPALMDLAQLHTAALFGRDEPSDDDARRAWARADSVTRAVRRSTNPLARLRARWCQSSSRRKRSRNERPCSPK